ncbi:MAG TPA: hypothetical protein VM734_34250 [Kofleriaceae bacterium]|jgi:hypothetical protein|nr:hypothetical protein [Kofleriaceae bacterium]
MLDADDRPSLTPALAPSAPPPVAPWLITALTATAAITFGAGLIAGRITARTPRVSAIASDPCALPAGVDASALPATDRAYVVRRAMLCRDVSHGRISADAYRAATAALDESPRPGPEAAPAMIWGSTVRDVSSQYGASEWSSLRALGAPDVYPAGGDHVNAWASLGADDRPEHLEVGLERAARLSAVEVFETFNPGAVTAIELITARGARQVIYNRPAAALGQPSFRRRVDVPCTDEPIVAIRLTLDSPAVPGWNEIDAIGGQPCR